MAVRTDVVTRIPFEQRPTVSGMESVTRELMVLLQPLARTKDARGGSLSWRILEDRHMPAPGVCVTEQRNIFLTLSLMRDIEREDFRDARALYVKFARVLGVPLHEVAHYLYSPDDFDAWAKYIERLHGRRAKVTSILFEEPRIEAQLLRHHCKDVSKWASGKVTSLMWQAFQATAEEQIARNLAQAAEENDGLPGGKATISRALVLVRGRLHGKSAVNTPGSMVGKVVDAVEAAVVEAFDDDAVRAADWMRRVDRVLREVVACADAYWLGDQAVAWAELMDELPTPPDPEPEGPVDPPDDPGDDPGEDPGEDPGDDPGEEPKVDPGDDTRDDDPGDEPGEEPGGEPGEEPGDSGDQPDTGERRNQPGDEAGGDTPEDGEEGERNAENPPPPTGVARKRDALDVLEDMVQAIVDEVTEEGNEYAPEQTEDQKQRAEDRVTQALSRIAFEREVSRERRTSLRPDRARAWGGRQS